MTAADAAATLVRPAIFKPLYRLDGEWERERQAVAVADVVEAVVPDPDRHVVLLGGGAGRAVLRARR